jgi:hypothetical protein
MAGSRSIAVRTVRVPNGMVQIAKLAFTGETLCFDGRPPGTRPILYPGQSNCLEINIFSTGR